MLTDEELEQLQIVLMRDKALYNHVLELLDDYDRLCVDYDDLIEELQEYEKEEYEEMKV